MHYGYLRLTKSSTLDLGPQTSLCDIRHNCSIICLLDYIDRSMGVASPSLLHAYSNDREVSIGFSTRFALRRHDTLLLLLLLLIYLLGPESGISGLQNRLVEDKYKQTFDIEIQKISSY